MKKIILSFILLISPLCFLSAKGPAISPVESYFKNQDLNFPLHISKPDFNNPSELTDNEKADLQAFYKHFSKSITQDVCKRWNENAVGFVCSNYGIMEDCGKKYFTVGIYAYYNDVELIYGQKEKVKGYDISYLYNILMFDYTTYKELGWVF